MPKPDHEWTLMITVGMSKAEASKIHSAIGRESEVALSSLIGKVEDNASEFDWELGCSECMKCHHAAFGKPCTPEEPCSPGEAGVGLGFDHPYTIEEEGQDGR